MEHATDVGCRIKRLLEEYDGRTHQVDNATPPNGRINVLDVWLDDGTHFLVSVIKVGN